MTHVDRDYDIKNRAFAVFQIAIILFWLRLSIYKSTHPELFCTNCYAIYTPFARSIDRYPILHE
jgi:hypothetical protein